MKQSFRPPKTNPLAVTLFRWLCPILHQKLLCGLSFDFLESDLARLTSYRGESMLFLPNHPMAEDPYVLFELSTRLNETFNYVAAREIFDLDHGIRGILLQLNGVYSVIRGASDRESFKMTKDILAQGKNRLAIFIEGEVSNENDTLIPFEPGVIQLAFWALDAKKAKNPDDMNLYMTPVGIKYVYHVGAEAYLEKALHDLEVEVLLDHESQRAGQQDFYQRIMTLGMTILQAQERRLNIIPLENSSLNERLDTLKDRLLCKMELFLDIIPPPAMSILDRIRAIRNRMDQMIYSFREPPPMSAYDKRMLEHVRLEVQEFYVELERVVNLLVLREGSIGSEKTIDKLIDVTRRLEREVYGQPRLKPPRTAVVRIGEIYNLKDFYADYVLDKKKTVQGLTHQLEIEMVQILSHAKQSREPIPEGVIR